MRTTIRIALFGLALVGILLIRYAGDSPRTAAAGAGKDTLTSDFALVDSSGQTVHLSDYKDKVVLLNFWATWCGPCNIEIPWFIDFENKYRSRGFVVLGVSMDDEGWNAVRPFMETKKINYPVVLGTTDLSRQFGDIDSLPTTFLIDRAGKIAATHTGLVSRDAYEREINRLLGS